MIQRQTNEVWVDDPQPGGWICGVCLYPVESEPCEQHDGAALTDEQLANLQDPDQRGAELGEMIFALLGRLGAGETR